MENKLVKFNQIGEVSFCWSNKASHISISIKPHNPVKVTVPENISYETAQQFLVSKITWVQRHLNEMNSKEKGLTVFDENTNFSTRYHTLKLLKHNKGTIKISVNNRIIRVYYPDFADASHPKVQTAIHKAVEEAWRIEAKAVLPKRVSELANKFGFKYQEVFIKNARTRWGSCSHNNRINLSLHLMMLPDHLIDYVILHELTHTIHKNHGQRFWEHLDKITGGVKKLEKEINSKRIGLF
jgi:predicted metal-dependent hydrolase